VFGDRTSLSFDHSIVSSTGQANSAVLPDNFEFRVFIIYLHVVGLVMTGDAIYTGVLGG
jgi:hypothetical protein